MIDPFEFTDEPTAAAAPTPHPGANASHDPPPYLSSLNDAQRQAVEATDGPVLVLAGAGTGKTRVLTTRLAHLLFSGKALPHEVLAVTFTNKAAREMKARVEAVLDRPVESLWIGTFHSVGARILRIHAEAVGLKPNFTILNSDDQVRLLKQLLTAAGIDEKRWPARLAAAVINGWKDRGLTPEDVAKVEKGGGGFAGGKAPALYKVYQERLKTLNAADFGDLLLHVLTIFKTRPEELAQYQHRLRYLLVDEYQDTNVSQYLWLRLLAQQHKNICCVGDDDQSIYSWRGAEVGNILRFEKDFPGAKVVRLEQNYRSTPNILAAASGLIAHNTGRLGKTLWTDKPDAEKVAIKGTWDGTEEARMVCDDIENAHRTGHPLSEFAILVRASFQTREFEERLLTLGIPYRVIGGLRFYEHREIRDAISYLRIIAQPDDDLAFERIINVPKRGLGTATLQILHTAARSGGIPLTVAAHKLLQTDDLRPAARTSLGNLMASFDRWRGMLDGMPHTEVTELMLDESGYTGMWQTDKAPDAPGRLENLKELITALEAFESLGGFLEHISLVMDNDAEAGDDKVNLMTLHGAKGLEFDTVFLPGWEEELFPHPRALDEGGADSLEEERRLAHVALTRARKRVTISFASSRRVYNQWRNALPSRFIDELPTNTVEISSDQGVYRGRGAGGGGEPTFRRPNSPDLDWPDRKTQVAEAVRRRQGKDFVTSGGLVIEGKAKHVDRDPTDGDFAVGDRVFHQKFGYGLVVTVDGNRLHIAFEKSGPKKVIDSFVSKVPKL
jgi:DNA helicase-2/ATP-dependent DNA helicase PcrA